MARAGISVLIIWAAVSAVLFAANFYGEPRWMALIAILELRGATIALATILVLEQFAATRVGPTRLTLLYGCLGWMCLVTFVAAPWLGYRYNPLGLFFAAWSFGLVSAATGAAKGIGGTVVAALGTMTFLALFFVRLGIS